ncbi:DoxX family protein [Actinoplanes friuliensis]|uniref:DoxX family protein n=1 Tax=Actinoplanes friuliensis DSM 7358 TaxID=1246995 RepID=U5WAB9_9ACTN|nr:DoxX family membrane protein [Actinoplanes friuliensis]AGZ46133.1 DoxX family protein [Actinoplanes friuliensis DSM 7358]
MATLIALAAGTGLARLLGLLGVDALDSWVTALRVGLALMFFLTGLAHFGLGRRAGMIAMVPPRLPRPDLLVTITGLLEFAGAVGLLLPATYRLAAVCLALLMVAMFPANVYAARHRITLADEPVTRLPLRTAEQLLYIGVALTIALV